MNKKLATLLFAVGIGASTGPALAFGPFDEYQCGYYCRQSYEECVAYGYGTQAECNMDRIDCEARCGI